MLWLYWTCFLLLIVVDVAGLLLAAFTLPGLWLMLGGATVYAIATHGHFLSWRTLLVLLALAGSAEVGEFVLGGAGAKRAGATKWGIVGGIVGAILGGIFLSGLIPVPVLGTVAGICLGTFAGASGIELALGQSLSQSVRIGVGAAKGRLTGIVGKLIVGLLMIGISLWAALPIGYHPNGKRALMTSTAKSPALRAPTTAATLP